MPGGDHKIKFIPVSDGDVIAWGKMGSQASVGEHHFLGFKPYPGNKRGGWIVVAIGIDAAPSTRPHRRRLK